MMLRNRISVVFESVFFLYTWNRTEHMSCGIVGTKLSHRFTQSWQIHTRWQFLVNKGCFIDRSRINYTETCNFHAQITAVSHKITAKLRFSVLNITAFDKDITFRRVQGAEKNYFPRPGRALAMSASSQSQNPLRIT